MKTNFFKLKISSYVDNLEIASNHIGEVSDLMICLV